MSGRKREVAKVLVIQLGPLGDFVRSMAAMKHIRAAHPLAHIALLTVPPFESLAQASPYVDMAMGDGKPEGFNETVALLGRLRSARYDRIYDLQGSSLTHLYARLLQPFAPQPNGRHAGLPLLERQAQQLKQAGIWPDAPTSPGAAPPPDLSWILTRPANRGAMAGSPKPYVLMAPGGWPAKTDNRWPADLYGKLAALLRPRGFDVLVIGGPDDSALARAIQRVSQARDLTGRHDAAHTATLAARASLAVGNDLDLLHLIAATGAPTLALLPKACDPVMAAPRGHVAVLQAERMSELAVEHVASTIERLLPANRKTV